jgi:transposase-like protein
VDGGDGLKWLAQVKERGLRGVQLIISDACMGLSESAAEFFTDAP